jgi:hypothetical protein
MRYMPHIAARSRDSPLCGIAQSRFSSSNLIEYLREFESICKTVLAHKSGDPGVQFNEKTEGRKSRETVPLRPVFLHKLTMNGMESKRVNTRNIDFQKRLLSPFFNVAEKVLHHFGRIGTRAARFPTTSAAA